MRLRLTSSALRAIQALPLVAVLACVHGAPPAHAQSSPPATEGASSSPPARPPVEEPSPQRVPDLSTERPPLDVSQQATPQIRWRLVNPFRLFVEPASTDLHMETYEALDERKRTRAVFEAERILSGRFAKGWAESVFRNICWDAQKHQYACKTEPDYLAPRSHRVIVELTGTAIARAPAESDNPAPPARCEWRLTPLQGKRNAVPRVMTAPCTEPLTIEVPYPGGLRVSVRSNGPPLAQSDISVQDLFIVGMGDSFGSGEGNPDHPVSFSRDRTIQYGKARGLDLKGYPARVGAWERIGDKIFVDNNAKWQDQACHRSVYSYQMRTALQLAVENPQRAVTFVGYACSGAEIIDGLFQIYKGNEWVPTPPTKSQISFAAEAQCGKSEAPSETFPATYDLGGELPVLKDLTVNRCPKAKARKIDLVLLSIGGNDIGFSRLVANAVLSDQSSLKTLGGWMGQVHGAAQAAPGLQQLDLRYKALSRALHLILHIPYGESDRVVLNGYPPLAILEDGKTVCPDDRGGMTVYPDFYFNSKRAGEGEKVAGQLHQHMTASSDKYGWSFAQRHRPEFNGHGMCAASQDTDINPHDDLRFPIFADGAWAPYNPADYRPYAPRARWFRTPNDAYLTGNFHLSATVANQLQKFKSLVWFQLLLAATYSGAFHPTAEGHAVIADSVLEKARAVLEKYETKVAGR
jgi:lysophospholipase L1-like esterase